MDLKKGYQDFLKGEGLKHQKKKKKKKNPRSSLSWKKTYLLHFGRFNCSVIIMRIVVKVIFFPISSQG